MYTGARASLENPSDKLQTRTTKRDRVNDMIPKINLKFSYNYWSKNSLTKTLKFDFPFKFCDKFKIGIHGEVSKSIVNKAFTQKSKTIKFKIQPCCACTAFISTWFFVTFEK